MNLQERIIKEYKRYLVSTQILCPITGKVLDVRTAIYSVDADGDPLRAYDPSCSEEQVADYETGIQEAVLLRLHAAIYAKD